jgi:hypothetical protein
MAKDTGIKPDNKTTGTLGGVKARETVIKSSVPNSKAKKKRKPGGGRRSGVRAKAATRKLILNTESTTKAINVGGRPLKYKTVEELQAAIDSYFGDESQKTTVTGLALYLGFSSRKELINYENRDRFSHTVKKAKARIEKYYEEHLMSKFFTGAIFALKNFGWSDKQEIEHSGDLKTPAINLTIVKK